MFFQKKRKICIFALCWSLFPNITHAGLIELPDAERPSAVQPAVPATKHDKFISKNSVEIPALIDRPFNIDDGPYIIVQAFRLQGADTTLTPNIDLPTIQALLDKQLQQQPSNGFSIGQLQKIADLITNYYRENGFILSQAIVPVQTVTDGTVDIQILIGRLGRILVKDNKKYSEDILRRPFVHLIGKPIKKNEIEAALLTLTDLPGLSVFGVFQPGLQVGKADMVLKIQQEKSYDVAFRIDNHGLPITGLNRLRANISWNNPTGGADKIDLIAQQSYNPKNTTFWAVAYERHIGNGFTTGMNLFRSRFKVNAGNNQTSAKTLEASFFLEKNLIKSREQNLFTKLSLTRKRSETFAAARPTNRDDLFILALRATYDLVDTINPLQGLYTKLFQLEPNFGGGLNFATIELRRGFNDLFGAIGPEPAALPPQRQGGPPNSRYATGQFTSLFASYSRLQLLSRNQSLLLKTELQYSRDLLVPIEQYSIGGVDNVRAFPSSEASFDSAYLLSIDYRVNAPFFADAPAFANRSWGEILQAFVFYDLAGGLRNKPLYNNDPKEQDSWIQFSGYGFGLLLSIPGAIDSQLIWAKKIKNGNNSSLTGNQDQSQIWFDFIYEF